MITIVALFSLVSGLVMLSAEKRKQIALLQTMGVSKRTVAQIFFIQGLCLSAIGVFIGVILGIILCYYAQHIAHALESLLGFNLVDEKIYGISHLPTSWSWHMVGAITVYGLCMGALASWYPAVRAARIHPAQVLRYG